MARHARDTARSARGWEQGRDTKICIVAEGGDFGSRYEGTALRYSAAARHDTTQGGLRHSAGAMTRRATTRVGAW